MKYRKKPVVIEAIQWNGANYRKILDFSVVEGKGCQVHWASPLLWKGYEGFSNDCLEVQTLEGAMLCQMNDWVIKGVKGEFYPCKPDIFEMTYEPVESSNL